MIISDARTWERSGRVAGPASGQTDRGTTTPTPTSRTHQRPEVRAIDQWPEIRLPINTCAAICWASFRRALVRCQPTVVDGESRRGRTPAHSSPVERLAARRTGPDGLPVLALPVELERALPIDHGRRTGAAGARASHFRRLGGLSTSARSGHAEWLTGGEMSCFLMSGNSSSAHA